ncbi:class I SAM-dependent methyltransferase [Robiginitomaculum antarcticum]|uniref:class I SAM-dependent methyltransferase n=1 Tax=Robiginitomaculum antarcticum TaxID=437507 RepID=UPI00036714F5|nr:class I SAM-dependent methyltransferase [Robiginitomaculum antarcticum]
MTLTSKLSAALLTACAMTLTACGGDETPDVKPAQTVEIETPEAVQLSVLETIAMDETRGEFTERNAWRNPVQTLEFMGLKPGMNVVEIWPGGGWYSSVLMPYAAQTGGTYTAALFPETSDYAKSGNANFRASYPDASTVTFGKDIGPLMNADGTAVQADMILSFRNVHNWMGGGYAEAAFETFYAGLKPGGTLGIVEHRLPATLEQDPRARSGYVQEDYVIAMAKEAGFELVERSDINANPNDTADHPFGVWTLPPVGRNAGRGEEADPAFDHAKYAAIGESDRMTLKFRKAE